MDSGRSTVLPLSDPLKQLVLSLFVDITRGHCQYYLNAIVVNDHFKTCCLRDLKEIASTLFVVFGLRQRRLRVGYIIFTIFTE